MNFHKFNWVVTPITITASNVLSFLEQINASSSIMYATLDLANAFFSIPIHKDRSLQMEMLYEASDQSR